MGLGILDPTKAVQSSYELSFSANSMVRDVILGVASLWMCLDTVPIMLSKLRPEQRQKVQGQVDFKGMSWISVVPRAKESFDLSGQQ